MFVAIRRGRRGIEIRICFTVKCELDRTRFLGEALTSWRLFRLTRFDAQAYCADVPIFWSRPFSEGVSEVASDVMFLVHVVHHEDSINARKLHGLVQCDILHEDGHSLNYLHHKRSHVVASLAPSVTSIAPMHYPRSPAIRWKLAVQLSTSPHDYTPESRPEASSGSRKSHGELMTLRGDLCSGWHDPLEKVYVLLDTTEI